MGAGFARPQDPFLATAPTPDLGLPLTPDVEHTFTLELGIEIKAVFKKFRATDYFPEEINVFLFY